MKLLNNTLVCLASALGFFSLISISNAQVPLTPTIIFTTDAQTPAVTGIANVDSGDSPADSDFYIRERGNAGEVDRRISTFLNFDVSSLTLADVNQPGFTASFTANYDFQLNNSNSAPAVVGRVTNGAWNGTSTLPLHSWGIDDASDRATMIADISALAVPASVSADVTDIVKGWVNGTHANYGLAVFMDELEFNGAGLSNPQLVITVSPNPGPPAIGPTPNIIVILVDDMGYGDLGVYNPNAQTTTPNLDAMAAGGMRFTDAHSPSAVCTPTRYALLTGRYAWRTRLASGVLNGSSRRLIATDRDTIPKLLQRRNYRTASMGKWHLGMTDSDGLNSIYQNSTNAQRRRGTNDVGFDKWFGIPASLDHIPYCIVSDGALVNMVDGTPSPSYDTWPTQLGSSSPRFIRRGPIAPGFDFEGLMGRLETDVTDYISDHVANHGNQPFFLYHPVPAPHAPWVPDLDTTNLTPEEIYIAFVDQIDDHVGIIMNKLADPNGDGNSSDSIVNDTLVVFTSDNGADSRHFSESSSGHDINLNWRGQKADIHEGGHRMPFIVKWPGNVPAGTVCDETICFTDLFATFADIVGQSYGIDAGPDSFSLRRVLFGEPFTSPIRGPVVHHSLSGMFAIREGQWKLIFGTGSGGFSGAAGEGSNTKTDDTPQRLYDLVANPTEILASNQISNEPMIVADLHAKLDVIRDNPRSAPVVPILAGDFDRDGFVDCEDLDFYVGNIGFSAAGALAQMDLNDDGIVTTADAGIHVSTLVQTSNGIVGTFLGDFNCDGTVDVLGDAAVLVQSLGDAVTRYSLGDANFDGTVDVLGDATVLIENLGDTNQP